MLCADIGVVQCFGLFTSECQHFFHSWCVRNVARRLTLGPSANLLFDGGAHGLKIKTHFLEHIDSNTLPKVNQTEQKMLSTNIVVMETISLFTGERQNLLCAWSEVIHRFHNLKLAEYINLVKIKCG